MHRPCGRRAVLAFTICLLVAIASAQSTENKDPAPPIHSQIEIADLQKKAEAGDSSSADALGRAYEDGSGVQKNLEKAAFWYRKAADQGNAKAQNSLGVLYWTGDGVEKDKKEAVSWFRKSARQGDGSGMFNLGMAYYNGEGVNTDDSLAYGWFMLSSEAGSRAGKDAAARSQSEHPHMFAEACLRVGQMFEKGEDLPKNIDSAALWYGKAQALDSREVLGSDEALLRLGAMYLRINNYSEAERWCEKAAKARLTGGYFCLGYMYQRGLGVAQNPKEAFRWYEQGARATHVPSMWVLAQMYEKGEGVPADRSEALAWSLLAAARHNHDALSEAKKLRSSMTEKEWKAAQKQLRQHNLDPTVVESLLKYDPPVTR